MNFIQLFNENKKELTKSEVKLANYIASHAEQVIYDTIKSLAIASDTSDATIIRLCKKLGFSGFSKLKIYLAQESISQNKLAATSADSNFYIESANLLIDSINKTKS